MKASVKTKGTFMTDKKAAAAEPKKRIITVKKMDMKYRGARAEWYSMLLKYNGKPEEDFLKAAKDKPPSLPKSQVPEPPVGWLRWFQRNGIATVG